MGSEPREAVPAQAGTSSLSAPLRAARLFLNSGFAGTRAGSGASGAAASRAPSRGLLGAVPAPRGAARGCCGWGRTKVGQRGRGAEVLQAQFLPLPQFPPFSLFPQFPPSLPSLHSLPSLIPSIYSSPPSPPPPPSPHSLMPSIPSIPSSPPSPALPPVPAGSPRPFPQGHLVARGHTAHFTLAAARPPRPRFPRLSLSPLLPIHAAPSPGRAQGPQGCSSRGHLGRGCHPGEDTATSKAELLPRGANLGMVLVVKAL